jgi:hypothetical protein
MGTVTVCENSETVSMITKHIHFACNTRSLLIHFWARGGTSRPNCSTFAQHNLRIETVEKNNTN